MDDDLPTERDSNGRFLPGRPSPNKRGRPPNRASKSNLVAALDPNAALILRLNRKTIRHIKDGHESEMTRLESAYEVLYKMAISGDMKAMKLYLEISNAAHAVEKHYREEFLGAAIAYKDYWLPIFDQCESRGRPVPSQLPHPRDIEIDPMAAS